MKSIGHLSDVGMMYQASKGGLGAGIGSLLLVQNHFKDKIKAQEEEGNQYDFGSEDDVFEIGSIGSINEESVKPNISKPFVSRNKVRLTSLLKSHNV